MDRPSWDEYFIGLLDHIKERSPCLRSHHAAIIVRDKRLIATGYNGPVSGEPHCLACARKDMPSGTGYDVCQAVHAEANAICQAARFGILLDGSMIYITKVPCSHCYKLIKSVGIKKVIFVDDSDGKDRRIIWVSDKDGTRTV